MPERRRALTILLSLTVVGVAGALPPLWRMDSAPTLLAWQTAGATVSPERAARFVGD